MLRVNVVPLDVPDHHVATEFFDRPFELPCMYRKYFI